MLKSPTKIIKFVPFKLTKLIMQIWIFIFGWVKMLETRSVWHSHQVNQSFMGSPRQLMIICMPEVWCQRWGSISKIESFAIRVQVEPWLTGQEWALGRATLKQNFSTCSSWSETKKINSHGIKGTKNVADGGTKYLDQRKFDIFKTKLGKGSSHPSQNILYQDYDAIRALTMPPRYKVDQPKKEL